MQKLQKVVEEWNETARSAWYMSYRTDAVIQGILQNPASAFHPTTWTVLNEAVPDWRRGLSPRRESEYLKSIFDY